MSRPLRIEFSGAPYHVTSRGDGKEDIFLDDNGMVYIPSVSIASASELDMFFRGATKPSLFKKNLSA